MAAYVKLLRSIWQDEDFKALDDAHQRLYMLLISQPDISHCGVLPLLPARWATLAANQTADDVADLLERLAVDNFVVVDHVTAEVWVRSYAIHDEAHKVPNGAKALVAAHARVLSTLLSRVIATQLVTLGLTLEERVSTRVGPPHHQQPSPLTITSSSSQDIAAAALNILIDHRVATTARTNPVGLRLQLERDLPLEHADTIDGYLREHPNSTAEQLARELGVPLDPGEVLEAWYANPHCETCDGDGHQNHAAEGEPAIYGPCPCRRPEPWLATVTDIRKEAGGGVR